MEKKDMNLRQRLAAVRAAIPTIQKQKHSDGVKYKFARIYDVYEFMRPAMVDAGVDWEISEILNPDGQQYFTTMEVTTKNGPRTVWVYESNIAITWINTDRPDDNETVYLHAVGTNDGGPDKAKGSALTYCLKYYLFEKFNIDQSEDDPDGQDLSSMTPAASPAAPAKLTRAQLNRMYAIGAKLGHAPDRINAHCAKKYGKQPEDLTRQEYDEICQTMERKIEAKEAETNDRPAATAD